MSDPRWKILSGSLVVGCACLAMTCEAQVSLISTSLRENLVGPTTLFSATVLNSGPSVNVVFSGDLSSADGAIVRFQSGSYALGAGMQVVDARMLTMGEFTYGSSVMARGVAMEHRLPSGEYRFCLTIGPAIEGEFGDVFCEEHMVEDLRSMDLVYPYDRDTIDEVRPALSWMITGGKVPLGQHARLVLVPKRSDADASQAITSERPLFAVEDLRSPWVPYPAGVASLEKGKCYAWQVERSDATTVVDRTEPWSFCVRDPRLPGPDRYVLLGEGTDAIYVPLDGHIRVQFADPYRSEGVEYAIRDDQGKLVASTERSGVPPSGTPSRYHNGTRLFDLDLQPFHLKPGHYTLTIMDAKGRPNALKFRIER